MAIRSVSAFDVTGWDQTRYEEEAAGPVLSRVTIRKSYHGQLVGESTAELLMCQADPSDLSSGAGYVASERVVGRLGGREGSFVMQHWGVSGSDAQRTAGHVVPGSGTGELAGLSGDVEIAVDAEGGHTLTLTYDIR
jgi:hypothetical protein